MSNIKSDFFSLPPSLEKLFNFLETNKGDYIDFIPEKDGAKISKLLPKSVAEYLAVIGQQYSRSLICYWKYDEQITWEKSPLVWLDSEGGTNSVFASNTDNFLSLLPLDTGGIYDLISSWQCYNSEPEYYISPLEKYAKNCPSFNYLIQLCKQNYSDYDFFVQWLEENLSIKMSENPAKLVGDAIKKFPNLDCWLTEKGIK
jgi:hypothetical protein